MGTTDSLAVISLMPAKNVSCFTHLCDSMFLLLRLAEDVLGRLPTVDIIEKCSRASNMKSQQA